MKRVETFSPGWGGQKVRDLLVCEDSGYVKGTVYCEGGRLRLHVEDINVRSQGRGLGTRLMEKIVREVGPDEITGEIVDSRALRIRKRLGGPHTVNDICGRELTIDKAMEGLDSGDLRIVFVRTKLK